MSKGAALGVLVAALAAALLAPAAHGQQAPAPVRVAEVRRESVQERRLVTGNVRAARRARVAAREPGLVLEVRVREGQRVAEGEVLARLDGRRLELDLAALAAEERAAEAGIAELESEAAQAERDVEALRELTSREAARPKELADAETALETARARIAAQRASVEVVRAREAVLRDRLRDLEVKSPFAGVVVLRLTEAGQWLGTGEAVAELTSDRMEAWLDVPQRDFAALTEGRGALQLRSDGAEREIELDDYRVVRDVDPSARSFPVAAPLPEGVALAPGMSVTAWVPTGERGERLTLPRDALLRNDRGFYVYVASGPPDGQQQALPVQVEVLFGLGARVAVTGPIEAGARVVVEGNERLHPMAPIAPRAAADAPHDAADGDGR